MLERDSADSFIAVLVDRRCFLAQVICVLSILIFLDQALDDFLSFIELAETIFERRFALVAFEESIALPQCVVLRYDALEERCNTGVIGKHEAGHAMR
jgi:hypothetical protein